MSVYSTPWIEQYPTPNRIVEFSHRSPAWTDQVSGGRFGGPLLLDHDELRKDIALAMLNAVLVGVAAYWIARVRLRAQRRCVRCGHQLLLEQQSCPECGTTMTKSGS
jgi:hypothetical protein